ncbi:MAG: hypothetical protein A2905_02680 [Candidatus Levybacteria bacterium RIFCSPLOWO2_01_FULL_36_10]|nr:MAG: hypothetical protein A2905_02680 [Candidatus Levybacteria bacterium RIFCSPLOWO2_01_FULL_36_10]
MAPLLEFGRVEAIFIGFYSNFFIIPQLEYFGNSLEQKTPYWKFFVGVASYLKENKISSLALIFVHSSALMVAPLMLGPALGISSRPLIAFYGYPSS